jgi:glutamate synthase (NADPH/NADH) small chain
MEKAILDRRLDQMTAEGVSFICNTNFGVDVQLEELRSMFDGVVLAIGSTRPRDLQIEGRGASGIHFAVDYLTAATKSHAGHSPSLSAKGRDVIILGGGDTGADCLGTALRQGAKSVTQLEIMPRPPESRTDSAPWPTMPLLYRVTSAHEEGGERLYAVRTTKALVDADGQISDIEVEPLTYEGTAAIPGEPFTLKCSMLLIAAGFVGADVLTIGGVPETPRGTIAVDHNWVALPADGALAPVVAAGDAVRGQSLIVWAIAEGRSAASCLDALLGGGALPRPLEPGTASW